MNVSKSKGSATLSGMMDTDVEDDTLNGDAFLAPDSNQENAGPKRRAAKPKPAAKQATKRKEQASRISGVSRPAKAAPAQRKQAGAKRVPLKEQSNQQYADDTEEVDEFAAQTEGDTVMDDAVGSEANAKNEAKKGHRPPKPKAQQSANEKQKDGEFEYTPTAVRTTKAARKPPASRKENIVQESQPSRDTDPSLLHDEDPDDQEMPQSVSRRPVASRNHSQSRRPLSLPRRRAGSASSTERSAGVTDAVTRRKLGEMTRKLDTLDLKYRTLRETGIKEAEANFERLRTQSEVRAKAAHSLITSLKREVATQKALSADTSTIQKEMGNRDADLIKTRALADDLSAQLAEAQNENKVLQAKLANSRGASAAVESLSAKTPGSASRARRELQGGRTIMVGSAEAAQAAQAAQLKEDLYSDLTGLIMRGVERGAESDMYDCIQTGRNGTLHFKLAIAKDPDESYENTEFHYMPRLDSNRDRDLIALLPDYLTDEITFARTNASLFYTRVAETLIKRRKSDDE